MCNAIPANLEVINDFGSQSEAERLRILLSFINEYIGDEHRFRGSKSRNKQTPLTTFIREWMKNNQIEELPLYVWNMKITKLVRTCPELAHDLRRTINQTWVWVRHCDIVDLRLLYNEIYNTMIDIIVTPLKRVRRLLEKKGFHLLGSGAYSEVWGSDDSDWVYKINKGEDDGWCEYVTWATMKGYTSTYAPRVHSLKKFYGFYIAKMEKLSKTLRDYRDSDEYSSSIEARASYQYFDQIRNATYSRDLKSLSNTVRNYADSNFPGLNQFFEELIKEFPSGLDLHDGNFMIDSRGFIIATDPICTSSVRGASPRIKHGHVVSVA